MVTLIFPWNIRENPKFPHFVILNIRRSMGAEDPAIEGDPETPEDGADGAEVGHGLFWVFVAVSVKILRNLYPCAKKTNHIHSKSNLHTFLYPFTKWMWDNYIHLIPFGGFLSHGGTPVDHPVVMSMTTGIEAHGDDEMGLPISRNCH